MAKGKTFREACCEKLRIPEDGFEEAVLWRCIPPHHLLIGKLQWRFHRAYFNSDLKLIRLVADCTSLAYLRAGLSYYLSSKPNYGFQRGLLRARMSGQRLVNFASTLLPSY
jgi:hypothetical protein